jgi:hypothetical protein
MKLVLFLVLLSGAILYATMPDDLLGSGKPRHLNSWGNYLSDLPQSERPHETDVAVRKPVYAAQHEYSAIAPAAEAGGATDTAALPEAAPSTTMEAQPAKLAPVNYDKKASANTGSQKARTAKVAAPAVLAGNRLNARRKALAPVQLTEFEAKASARTTKRRGFGLFLFGRRHANQQATIARE